MKDIIMKKLTSLNKLSFIFPHCIVYLGFLTTAMAVPKDAFFIHRFAYINIAAALVFLFVTRKIEKRVRQKQNKRSAMEGFIGVSKVHYGLERLLYKNEELNIRLGLIAMNLSTAMARI